MGATAAQVLARQNAESIGFIGAGEQAKMHLLGMKSVRPALKVCKVAAVSQAEEEAFIRDLSPLLPDMVEMAEFLAKDFPMVRVDLFDVGGRIILSEMTFTPGGALIPFAPAAADRMLGDKLDISGLMKERVQNV